MGLREWFDRHPKTTYGAVGTCLLIAVGMIVSQVLAARHTYPPKPPDSYYTVDDGQTYFVASSTLYPPFDHDGQQAVHAIVFRDESGNKFVGLLERYNADVKKQLDAGKPLTIEMTRFGREIKHPGDTKWTKTGDMIVEGKITNITTHDGKAVVDVVEP